MTLWSRAPNLAVVDSEHRRAVLVLDRPTQPPVVLEGAAREIFDAIDGQLSSGDIVHLLTLAHPDEPRLEEQVMACLQQLLNAGLVTTHPSL